MIDSVYVLNKMGLQPGMSVSRAIIKVGTDINESGDELRTANKIIVSLGSQPVSNNIMANILAKALVEQAVVRGASYDPVDAASVAMEKFKKIERTMPYIFASTETAQSAEDSTSKRGGDKKARALDIYNRETGKPGSEIATIIASELDITYANAYYYVSRVFAKYKK